MTPEEKAEMAMAGIGGRRFVLCILTLVVTTVLTWFAKIDGAIYRDLMIATVAALVAGNTIQKVKTTKSTTTTTTEEPA